MLAGIATTAQAQQAAPTPLVPGAQVPAAQAPAAPSGTDGTVDGLLHALHLKSKPQPMPDFVRKSRPASDQINYIPVSKQHPERTEKVLTPAEVAAAEQDLDKARMDQQRRAGLKPVPVPDKPKKAAAKPAATTTR